MSPYTAFGLSVAASVFIPKATRFGPSDSSFTSLEFIRSAMQAITKIHPITGSFLVQLDIAMESCGLRKASPASLSSGVGLKQGFTDSPAKLTPDSAEATSMADDLKKYKSLPVNLEGIMPARVHGQNDCPIPYQTLEHNFSEAQPALGGVLDFEYDLNASLLPDWEPGELYPTHFDLPSDNLSNRYLGTLDEACFDEADPQSLTGSFRLGPLQAPP